MNIQNLILDINKKPFQIITANTGEVASRFIRVNIVDGATPMDITGVAVSMYAEKPDGKKVFNNVSIENEKNGVVLIELTSQVLAVEGSVKLNLLLEKDNARLCTKQFLLKVDKSLVDDEAIESINEFGVLTKALDKVDEWNGYFEETSGKIEEKYTERLNQVNSQLAQVVINVKNFGATGDGVTDDTKYLIECIDYAINNNYCNIYFPCGVYKITSSIKLYENINFVGANKYSTTIKYDGNNSLFFTDELIKSISIENLSFESNTSNFLIDLTNVNNSTFNNLQFNGIEKAIYMSALPGFKQCYYNQFVNVKFSYCNIAIELNNNANANSFLNCNFIGYNIGINLISGEDNNFTNCSFETFSDSSNSVKGIYFGNSGIGNNIISCRFEQKDGYPLYCENDAKHNICVSSKLMSKTLTPCCRGFDGNSHNNTIISPLSSTTLTNVNNISSNDETYSTLNFNSFNKTKNGIGFLFKGLKSDLATMQNIVNIKAATDNPTFYLYDNVTLHNAGLSIFENDFKITGFRKGLVLRSNNGEKYFRIRVTDSGEILTEEVE